MTDFHAFAVGGKQGGVVADNIAGAHGGKADGGRVARAGVAFATIHGALLQIAAERIGNHFAHAQRGAAGCIHFMAVVAFDDFDVVAFVEHARHGVENVKGEIHAHAEIGGKHNAGLLGRRSNGGFAGLIEAGGADNHLHTGGGTFFKMRQSGLGAGEINQHIAGREHGIDIAADGHAGFEAE